MRYSWGSEDPTTTLNTWYEGACSNHGLQLRRLFKTDSTTIWSHFPTNWFSSWKCREPNEKLQFNSLGEDHFCFYGFPLTQNVAKQERWNIAPKFTQDTARYMTWCMACYKIYDTWHGAWHVTRYVTRSDTAWYMIWCMACYEICNKEWYMTS